MTTEQNKKDATAERAAQTRQRSSDRKLEEMASDKVSREDRKDMGRGRLSRGHRRADTDECRELDHGTRLATPAEEERIQKGETIDPRDEPDMSAPKGDVAIGAQNPGKLPGRGSAEDRAKREEKAAKGAKEATAEEQATMAEDEHAVRKSAIGHGFP